MKKITFAGLLAGAAILCVAGPEVFCQAKLTAAPAVEPAAGPGIHWLTDYDAALKQAKASNQLVVIDFFAPWCGYCKLMDKTTFLAPKVQERLTSFVALKIDQDKAPELAMKYGVPGLPTMLVIDATGKPILGTAGYVPANSYLDVLDRAASKNAANNSVN